MARHNLATPAVALSIAARSTARPTTWGARWLLALLALTPVVVAVSSLARAAPPRPALPIARPAECSHDGCADDEACAILPENERPRCYPLAPRGECRGDQRRVRAPTWWAMIPRVELGVVCAPPRAAGVSPRP